MDGDPAGEIDLFEEIYKAGGCQARLKALGSHQKVEAWLRSNGVSTHTKSLAQGTDLGFRIGSREGGDMGATAIRCENADSRVLVHSGRLTLSSGDLRIS